MRLGGRLQAVVDILTEAEQQAAPASLVGKSYIKKRRYIGSKDRRFIMERLMLVMRKKGELEVHCKHASVDVSWPAITLVAELLYHQTAGEDIGAAIAEPHWTENIVPQEIEALQSYIQCVPELSLRERVNIPLWAWNKWSALYGDEEAMIAALEQERPAYIRVNTRQMSVDELVETLEQHEINAVPHATIQKCLEIKGSATKLTRLPAYENGAFYVQDIGSQAIMSALPVNDGMRIIDYCAGAGGKSLALLTQPYKNIHITLCDVEEARLQEAKRRLTAMHLQQHTNLHLLGEDKPLKPAIADMVIVDAPCSGSGLWFRKPDRRYIYNEQNIAKFVDKQLKILIKSSSCVTVGGWLVYITCSLFSEENESLIEAFEKNSENVWERECVRNNALPDGPDYALAKNSGGSVVNNREKWAKLLPWQHGSDGFFVCLWKRVS